MNEELNPEYPMGNRTTIRNLEREIARISRECIERMGERDDLAAAILWLEKHWGCIEHAPADNGMSWGLVDFSGQRIHWYGSLISAVDAGRKLGTKPVPVAVEDKWFPP